MSPEQLRKMELLAFCTDPIILNVVLEYYIGKAVLVRIVLPHKIPFMN